MTVQLKESGKKIYTACKICKYVVEKTMRKIHLECAHQLITDFDNANTYFE